MPKGYDHYALDPAGNVIQKHQVMDDKYAKIQIITEKSTEVKYQVFILGYVLGE